MAQVEVTVKYSNRTSPRVYRISGEDFETIKNAVKATNGARYDGARKAWSISAQALKDLKADSRFQVTVADLIGRMSGEVWFAGAQETALVVKAKSRIGTTVHAPELVADKAAELAATLQAAYNKSDEEFGRVYGELAANGTTIEVFVD